MTKSAEGSAKYVTMAHGHGEYAHVSLRVHPSEAGSGFGIEDTTIGRTIPKRFMPSVEIGIRESMANGVPNGYPIVDVRVEVHDGSYHETDSTDAAFRTAAAMAFQDAARKAQPVVLEPVMQVVVRTDDKYVTTVLDGLMKRRGEFKRRARESIEEVLTAHVPLSELFRFERQLRAETHGHASCSISFACYQPVVQGPAGDDDDTSRVSAPRRPAPNLHSSSASIPEPDDSYTEV